MTLTRKVLGLITLGAGTIILCVSAKFSFEGFAGTFESISGAGWIGVGFAILAFATVSAVRIFHDDSDRSMRQIAIALLVISLSGDLIGNWQAMDLQTVQSNQSDQDRLEAYNAAVLALPRVRDEIDQLAINLKTVNGTDIYAAQKLLKVLGRYDGKIDGKAGGKTEAAMLAFGIAARESSKALSAEETRLNHVVASGAPIIKGSHRDIINVVLALFLTISTSFASLTGTRLIVGAAEMDAVEASTEAKAASAEIISLLGKAA
ncbi:MAG: peptidoglycan-binding domain-containing protein [Pseudomonadota bacterium]